MRKGVSIKLKVLIKLYKYWRWLIWTSVIIKLIIKNIELNKLNQWINWDILKQNYR